MSKSNPKDEHFSLIPESVLYADISDGAYRLYGALARVVDSSERVGFVLIKTLAKRLKRSESSIKRHLKELVDAGLVNSQHQWVDEHGEYHTHYESGWRQTANVYTLPRNPSRGSKYDPPVKNEPMNNTYGSKTEPPAHSKTERGAGSKNDTQYKNPVKPEPAHPKEKPPQTGFLLAFENDKVEAVENSVRPALSAARQSPPDDVKQALDKFRQLRAS